MKLWSWNLDGAFNLAADVVRTLADADVDLVLAQEVKSRVAQSGFRIVCPTNTDLGVRGENSHFAAVLHRGDVEVSPVPQVVPLNGARWDQLGASVMGSLAAATLHAPGVDPIVLISVYCPWDGPGLEGQRGSGLTVSDANAYRVVSDISMLSEVIDRPDDHRILVAGDWNIMYGYGQGGSAYWAARYSTVFERMRDLGFEFCGPQAPEGGRQADPWPKELPVDSRCVPTFHSSKRSPVEAERQIDFVFASKSIADRVTTRALNQPSEWGSSDHCRVLIEVDL